MTFGKAVILLVVLSSHFIWAQEVPATAASENHFFLTFNQAQPFLFLGKVDVNKTVAGGGSMLYPADSPLVFFTAVVTHAAIAGGVERSRLSKEQEKANAVLASYQSYIDRFNTAENIFMPQLDVQLDSGEQQVFFIKDEALKHTAKWEVAASPVFFLTQNHGSLILYNKIVVREMVQELDKKPKKNKSAKPRATKKRDAGDSEKIVVVISDPIAEQDHQKFWSDNDGANFTNTLKSMYKESLALLLGSLLAQQQAQMSEQVTVKYTEDGVKKVERGYVIGASCRRTLFASLSGEIKSVPNLDFFSCATAS